ncbi:MAG: tetratricopeptide repeat protein [Myxococcota bacterium]|nr:tetratricopeptide repeat protein [Myxococcota bacterium]
MKMLSESNMKYSFCLSIAAPLAVSALLLIGCGSRQIQSNKTVLEMEPVVVEVSKKDGKNVIETYDAFSLFESAKTFYEQNQFARCINDYTQLLERFPSSRFALVALFNRGLCLEEALRHNAAATDFRLYIDRAKKASDKLDGQYRWGFNLVESGNYPIAVKLYDDLLSRTDLGHFDRAEAHLRRGISLAKMQQFARGEGDIRAALKWIKKETGDQIIGNDLAAECHYRKGEIYGALSSKVSLKLPLKSMQGDLQSKIRFFRQSQSSYIDTLNVRSPYWSTAAGLKLGELYERFYDDVVKAEVPKDFDETMRKYYLLELKNELQPVLTHSVKIYERNIAMGLRLGTDNQWIKETEQRLQKLRALIEKNERAAEAARKTKPETEMIDKQARPARRSKAKDAEQR